MTLAGGKNWEKSSSGPQHSTRGNGNQNVGYQESGGVDHDGHTSEITAFQGAYNFVINQTENTPLFQNITGNYNVHNFHRPSASSSDPIPEQSHQNDHTPGAYDSAEGYDENLEYNANPQLEDDHKSPEELPQGNPYSSSSGRDPRLGDQNFNGAHGFRQSGGQRFSVGDRVLFDTTTVTPLSSTQNYNRRGQQRQQRFNHTEGNAPSRAWEDDSNSRQKGVQSPERVPQNKSPSSSPCRAPHTGVSLNNSAHRFTLNNVIVAHVRGNLIGHTNSTTTFAPPVSSLETGGAPEDNTYSSIPGRDPRLGDSHYNGAYNFMQSNVNIAHVNGRTKHTTSKTTVVPPFSSLEVQQQQQRSDFTSQQSPPFGWSFNPPPPPARGIAAPNRISHQYNAASRASRLIGQRSQYFERTPRSSPALSPAPQHTQGEHRAQVHQHENSDSTSLRSRTSFSVPQRIQEENKVSSPAIFAVPHHFQEKQKVPGNGHIELQVPQGVRRSGTREEVQYFAQERVESTSRSAPVVFPVPQRTQEAPVSRRKRPVFKLLGKIFGSKTSK